MATYKLIQDIEAEDHILGPFTLRQFIYGMISAFLYYICFVVISKHAEVLLLFFLPPTLLTSFFAFPFKRDQPTEVWALARLRFLFKPRRRIWSQSGIKNLVTITAPKKVERNLTNGLSTTEVKSRLQALALTLDTRGWAVKNLVDVPVDSQIYTPDSDRLIDMGTIPKPVPDYYAAPDADMFDDQNPKSQQIAEMISKSSRASRQDLVSMLNKLDSNTGNNQMPVNKIEEDSLSEALKRNTENSNLAYSNMQTLSSSPKPAAPKIQAKPIANQLPHIDRAKLNFALSNPGLSVQTLANEVKSTKGSDGVVIDLHH